MRARTPGIGTAEPLERGDLMAITRERTKEQLYSQAKRLNIKGRSKMNKRQLLAAVNRKK